MTSKEFIIWLKGFSKAANEYNITPKQWETIVEQLNKVQDEISLQDGVKPYIDPTSIPKPIKII